MVNLTAKDQYTATIDCVGILKLRNAGISDEFCICLSSRVYITQLTRLADLDAAQIYTLFDVEFLVV